MDSGKSLRNDQSRKDKDMKDAVKQKDTATKKRPAANADFLCEPQFSNTLPNPPSGPFFKRVGPVHTNEQFATFKVNSLEKSYVWQPHFGPDVGIKLDLVDQESILIPEVLSTDKIQQHHEDAKYLQAPDRVKGKTYSNRDKPWWLRNTVYLENNLYNPAPMAKTKDDNQQASKRLKLIDDLFSSATAEASFASVSLTESRLVKERKKKSDVTLEWAIPILPDTFFQFNPALVTFDEDVANLAKTRNAADNGHRDASKAIIAHLRPMRENGKQHVGTFYASSLLCTAEEAPTTDPLSSDPVHYDWLSDFKMEIRNTNLDEYFVLTINPSNVSEPATYSSVSSRIGMRALPVEEFDAHEAFVSRRPDEEES